MSNILALLRSSARLQRTTKLSKSASSHHDTVFLILMLMVSSLIAISGLGGHAFGSFKEKNGQHMWLRDSLPGNITRQDNTRPIARIMTYGHESNLAQSDSFQNLGDLGNAFQSQLCRLKKTDGAFRPMVLVAHSLGGLIVKEVGHFPPT